MEHNIECDDDSERCLDHNDPNTIGTAEGKNLKQLEQSLPSSSSNTHNHISPQEYQIICRFLRSFIPKHIISLLIEYHIPVPENDFILAFYIFTIAFAVRVMTSRLLIVAFFSLASFTVGLLWHDWSAEFGITGVQRLQKYAHRLNKIRDVANDATVVQAFLEEQTASKNRMLVKISGRLEPRLNYFVNLIVQKYVLNWYTNLNKSNDPEFPDAVRTSLLSAFAQLGHTVNRCNPTDFLLGGIDRFVNHVKQFRDFERSGLTLEQFAKTYPDSSLTKAVKTNDVFNRLRDLSMRLCIRILPKSDRSSPVVFALAREILATSVLLPLIEKFSDPIWINSRLVTVLKKKSKTKNNQDIPVTGRTKSGVKSNVGPNIQAKRHRNPERRFVELFVKVIEGRDFPLVSSASMYFCSISCGSHILKTRKVVPDTNPVWGEDLHLMIPREDAESFQQLCIKTHAGKSISSDEVVASVSIPIQSISPNKFIKDSYLMDLNPKLKLSQNEPARLSLEIIYVNTDIIVPSPQVFNIAEPQELNLYSDTTSLDLEKVLSHSEGIRAFSQFIEGSNPTSQLLSEHWRVFSSINALEKQEAGDSDATTIQTKKQAALSALDTLCSSYKSRSEFYNVKDAALQSTHVLGDMEMIYKLSNLMQIALRDNIDAIDLDEQYSKPLKRCLALFFQTEIGEAFALSPEYQSVMKTIQTDYSTPISESQSLRNEPDAEDGFSEDINQSDDATQANEGVLNPIKLPVTEDNQEVLLSDIIEGATESSPIQSNGHKIGALKQAISFVQEKLDDVVRLMAGGESGDIQSLIESKIGYQSELSKLNDWLDEEKGASNTELSEYTVQDQLVCCIVELQEPSEILPNSIGTTFSNSILNMGLKNKTPPLSTSLESSPSRLKTSNSRSTSPENKAKRRSFGTLVDSVPFMMGSGSNVTQKLQSMRPFSVAIRVDEKHTGRGWVVTRGIDELESLRETLLEELPRSQGLMLPTWIVDGVPVINQDREVQETWRMDANEWLTTLLSDPVFSVAPQIFTFFSITRPETSKIESVSSLTSSFTSNKQPVTKSAALMFSAFKNAGTALKKVTSSGMVSSMSNMADSLAQTASESVNALAFSSSTMAAAGAATLKRLGSVSNMETSDVNRGLTSSLKHGSLDETQLKNVDNVENACQEMETLKPECLIEDPIKQDSVNQEADPELASIQTIDKPMKTQSDTHESVSALSLEIPLNKDDHHENLLSPDSPVEKHRVSEADLALLLDCLFAGIEELFHLTAPHQWMKQQSLNVVKLVLQKTYTQKLSKLLKDKVEKILTEETVERFLDTVSNAISPQDESNLGQQGSQSGSKRANEPQSKSTGDHTISQNPALKSIPEDPLKGLSQDEIRIQAKQLLTLGQGSILESSLDTLSRVLGRSTMTIGLTRVFNMMQRQDLNRALILSVLETIVETILVA